MVNFDYMTPTRLIFGKDSIEKLPEVMNQFGPKILLTYGGGSIKKIGLYDKVKELLAGREIVELSGIQPNPKYDPSVLEGVRLCKENKVDVILAVGGGSVLDCSKAIAAGAKYDGDPWDLVLDSGKIGRTLPFFAVLTLAATGSDLSLSLHLLFTYCMNFLGSTFLFRISTMSSPIISRSSAESKANLMM